MYNGKHDVFNAPTVHLDEVETLAPGTTVLATNAVSDVQSAEIRCNGAVAWGVQYHPEYPLREVAAIVRRIGKRLINEGFFLDEADIKIFAGDLDVLDPNPADKRLAWRYGISKNVLDKTAAHRRGRELDRVPGAADARQARAGLTQKNAPRRVAKIRSMRGRARSRTRITSLPNHNERTRHRFRAG